MVYLKRCQGVQSFGGRVGEERSADWFLFLAEQVVLLL